MKHKNKALLLIIGVAIMLAGATSANGYYEAWNGWFNSGSLYYNNKTYTIVENYGTVNDSTYSEERDTFYLVVDAAITFVCAAGPGDSIFVCIPTFTGGKDYGTSDTHEGSGLWSGSGYTDDSGGTKLFDFGGTWDTDDAGDYFNYNSRPDPTYTADWDVTTSSPVGVVTGSGTCSGDRTYYED